MSKRTANVTRLELVIIVAALLVLLFCNQSPQPGSADIGPSADEMGMHTPDPTPPTWPDNLWVPDVTPAPQVSSPPIETRPAPSGTPDNPPTVSIPQQRPPAKRYARVDARNSPTLQYPEVMYGEVTVRWVWNGTKLEGRIVCEVKEKNGAVSIWNFDDRYEGVVIEELPPGEIPPY